MPPVENWVLIEYIIQLTCFLATTAGLETRNTQLLMLKVVIPTSERRIEQGCEGVASLSASAQRSTGRTRKKSRVSLTSSELPTRSGDAAVPVGAALG
jgi:hypothetical protein